MTQIHAGMTQTGIAMAGWSVWKRRRIRRGCRPWEASWSAEQLPLVFQEDLSEGAGRWESTDSAAWTLDRDGARAVWGGNRGISDYKPKVRSPHNEALAKHVELSGTVITF
jgi:hypothetical protein